MRIYRVCFRFLFLLLVFLVTSFSNSIEPRCDAPFKVLINFEQLRRPALCGKLVEGPLPPERTILYGRALVRSVPCAAFGLILHLLLRSEKERYYIANPNFGVYHTSFRP